MKFSLVAVLSACIFLVAASVRASETDVTSVQNQVEALFEPTRDLLDVKLTVDAIVDPLVNKGELSATVDAMVADIGEMAGENPGSAVLLASLKKYLYEGGIWNDNRPFQYDFDDPLGTKPANRLLARYLATRRGNCVTMPLLFLALGQRLGLKMTLAEAPLHIFVKYTDDEGKIWNLEPTSGGGFTRDEWYRQKLPMSDQAVANGVYLRALTHQESVALIASFLVERDIASGRFEDALTAAKILLQHYPNFAYGLIQQGNGYNGLLRQKLAGKSTRVDEIPSDLKKKADRWYRQNQEAFARAQALGWRMQDGQIQ